MSAISRRPGPATRCFRLSLRCCQPSALLRRSSPPASLATFRVCRTLTSSAITTTTPLANSIFPKLPTASIFRQSRAFRALPVLSRHHVDSTPEPDPPGQDEQYCMLPLPPNVHLPPLPKGWARLSAEETAVLVEILSDLPKKFLPILKDTIEKAMWTQCYLGLPEDSAKIARSMMQAYQSDSVTFSNVTITQILSSTKSVLEMAKGGEVFNYHGHPVIRDLIENNRWKEWSTAKTRQMVQLTYSAEMPRPEWSQTLDRMKKEDEGPKEAAKKQQGQEAKPSTPSSSEAEAKDGETVKPEDKSRSFGPPPPPRPASFSRQQSDSSKEPPNKDPKKDDKDGNLRIAEIVAYAMTVGFLWALFDIFSGSSSEREITWQELRKNFLDKGLVEKLIVNGQRVRVDLNLEATRAVYPDSIAANPYFHYYFSIGSIDAFERKVEDAQAELGIPSSERIPISYKEEGTGFWGNMLISWGSTVLFVGLLVWMSRSASRGGGAGGFMNFQKSKAKRFSHETAVKIKFADVAGADEAKVEIMEFVSFLKTPERFQRLGAKIPRGAILSGPPGTGKTLLAKATAGESNVPFFSVSGSEFVEMFVGVGASRVRDLFATARKNAPCIIFIDEIDAVGKQRSQRAGGFGGNEEREATLNQILTEMDGFNTSEQVVVLAGTNRPDMLDKALTRPGRFDRHITIDRPTLKGRADIFRVHLKKVVTNEDMDRLCGRLAALTPGFAGADIANAVNEAALIAARANAEFIAMTHFEQAIERVVAGLERKSLVLSKEEKRTVAYHEAGHAICGWYFQHADPLLKVSIIPRGQGALGYAQYLPAGDAYLMSVNQLMDRMAMTLGGRVSEELHFPTVTTGASDDFKKVTQMATTMVTQWGMSEKLGPLHFNQDQNQWQKPFAEATAQTIDAEVRRIVDEAYKQCKDLLISRKKEIGIIAEELLRKEVLTRDDLVRLLGQRQWPDREEFSKYFSGEQGGKLAPPPFPTENTDSPSPDDTEPPRPAAEFKGQERPQ